MFFNYLINMDTMPKTLSEEELLNYFKELNNGNKQVRNKIVFLICD